MNFSHQTQSPLHPVVLRAESNDIQARMQALAELASIEMCLASATNSTTNGVLFFDEEYGMKVPSVRAHFHPTYAAYFTVGSIVLDIEEEAGDILELMIAAGATSRGKVIGFLSSHGGAGSTTLACMLARRLTSTAPAHSVALMDCDPLSAGIENWCGVDIPGINWADLDEKAGVLVPGQLAKALPRRKTLHVLSADERGGMPPNGQLPTRAVAALAQSHDVTILDMSRCLLTGNTDLISWCDILVLVTDTAPHAVGQTRRTLYALEKGGLHMPLLLAINRVSGGTQAASIAYDIGIEDIAPIHLSRTLPKDLEHGISLGERTRSTITKDVAHLANIIDRAY